MRSRLARRGPALGPGLTLCPPWFPSGMEEEQRLLGLVQHLEQELGRLKADLAGWQRGRSSCEAADSVRETVGSSGSRVLPEGREQWVSCARLRSCFVSGFFENLILPHSEVLNV